MKKGEQRKMHTKGVASFEKGVQKVDEKQKLKKGRVHRKGEQEEEIEQEQSKQEVFFFQNKKKRRKRKH